MKIKRLLPIVLILLFASNFYAQSSLHIEGKILDAKTKKPIPFATLLVKNERLGLYASEEGGFSFRMRDKFKDDSVIISSIGYKKIVVPFSELTTSKLNILYMSPAAEQLDEISIVASKKLSKKEQRLRSRSKSLIREAIRRIPQNYPVEPFTQMSYYRDYLKRDGNYYNVNEGIVQTVDNGFKTLHLDTQFRLMYYRKNKNFPRLNSIPQVYDSVRTTADPNENKKSISYAIIGNQGGNELFILLAHDPIRNYKSRSFSFVDRLSVDFLKNHTFKKPTPVFQNDRLLYKVDFNAEKLLIDESKKKVEKFSGSSTSMVSSVPSEVQSKDIMIVKGEIYINPEDFTIHKLDYKVTLKSTMKKVYALSLEYGYSDASETSMRLKYVSFNNEFFATEDNNLEGVIGERQDIFEITRYKQKEEFIDLYTNAPVNAKSAEDKSLYKITTLSGDTISINRVNVIDNVIRIYYDNELELDNPLNIEVSNIRDVNGRMINRRRTVRYYQYRELFVQELDKEIELKKKCFMRDLPMDKNCISRSKDLRKYIINSPLSNN